MEEEVKVHGSWASPFSYRVIWALQLKRIPYHFIQEHMANKTPLLLHYNPVHKKIPVLVHAGNPICESAVILEYIDDTWPEKPLLPSDPFHRATARFWIKFIEDKVRQSFSYSNSALFRSEDIFGSFDFSIGSDD